MESHRAQTRRDAIEGVMHTFSVRLRRRAWSRAGAIAAVVRSGTTRRVLSMSSRVLLLVFGAFMISASVAVTLWNELGPGPLDVFIGAMRERTGVPLTFAIWGTTAALIAVAWVLGRRPGVGTIAAPLLIGPMMQAVVAALDVFDAPSSIVVRVGFHLVAIVGIGIGAGALIVSGLGAGTGELFAGAASDRFHRSEASVRPFIELSWIVIGVALGGPAGIGTVLVGVFVGPSVANGYRLVDSAAGRWVKRLHTTHDAILVREGAAVVREHELANR